MRYKISNEAAKDLEEIWLHSQKQWSVEQADKYYNLLMDEIEYVSVHPQSGKDYSQIREGYLRTRVNSHFIFYKVSTKDKLVEIIRILHQQMDIEERLNE